jgi:methyltransferase OMS1
MKAARILQATVRNAPSAKRVAKDNLAIGVAKARTTDGSAPTWTKRPPPPAKPKTMLRFATLTAVMVLTGYATFAFVLAKADPTIVQRHNVPDDVSDRYDQTAQDFDSEVGTSEMVMGLNWLRSWLVRRAEGNVLEVSAGTARNARYYDEKKCTTITMLDQSAAMVQKARQNFKSL